MKLDLTKLTRQTQNAPKGGLRVEVTGPRAIEFDEKAFIERIADLWAMTMRQNVYNGLRPDGAGGMPGREKDGRPRGQGAEVVRTIHPVPAGHLAHRIEATEKVPGHLARILQEVPFTPPPLDGLSRAVDVAFHKSVKVDR